MGELIILEILLIMVGAIFCVFFLIFSDMAFNNDVASVENIGMLGLVMLLAMILIPTITACLY